MKLTWWILLIAAEGLEQNRLMVGWKEAVLATLVADRIIFFKRPSFISIDLFLNKNETVHYRIIQSNYIIPFPFAAVPGWLQVMQLHFLGIYHFGMILLLFYSVLTAFHKSFQLKNDTIDEFIFYLCAFTCIVALFFGVIDVWIDITFIL